MIESYLSKKFVIPSNCKYYRLLLSLVVVVVVVVDSVYIKFVGYNLKLHTMSVIVTS